MLMRSAFCHGKGKFSPMLNHVPAHEDVFCA